MSSTVPVGLVTPPSTSGKPAPISTTSTVKPHSPPLSQPTSPIRSISPPSPPAASTTFRTVPTSTSTPSSSQIFERNVQETSGASLAGATGANVPAHIATENHIPAVLEATSIAITDGSIDPDNVEIAVLTSHQSLAAQNSMLHHHHQQQCTQHLSPSPPQSPPTSSSGSPLLQQSSPSPSASSDARRRLSFISFSDIVQAEQADLLDSTILSPNPTQTTMLPGAASVMDQVGISSITETLVRRRTPSPMRYGGSGGRATSPVSFLGSRVPMGRGPEEEREDVLVQTMGQALRKTGSGDLGRSI